MRKVVGQYSNLFTPATKMRMELTSHLRLALYIVWPRMPNVRALG